LFVYDTLLMLLNCHSLKTVLPQIIQGIANFSEKARAADAKQRAVMVCEIKSLLLPTFDEVNEKATYPKPECSTLIEKLVLPSNPNKPSN
jgi:hypothetical protein